MKFAANLSFLFKEKENLLDRYAAAQQAGFKGVEVAFPYEFPLEDVVEAKKKSGLQQVLINSYPGKLEAGQMGLAALPSYVGEFRSGLDLSISYCKALECTKLHIMAGKRMPNIMDHGMGPTYSDNLKYAAKLLEENGIVGLIEPINSHTIPGYFLNDFQSALSYIREINSPNLKLQLDVFHMQHICGNLSLNIQQLMPYIGHIQIAQVPHRHEPDTAGEIDYRYLLKLIEEGGYEGWVGCEYIPAGSTEEGLKWVQKLGYSL